VVDGIVDLVGAGFDEDEVIRKWPYDKFTLFSKAVRRQKLRDRLDFVQDVSHAIGGVIGGEKGKENPLTTYFRQLRGDIEKLDGV